MASKKTSLPKGYNPQIVGDHLPITGERTVRRGVWRKPKLNLSWLKRISIHNSSHEVQEDSVTGHCVMEAFAIATGQSFTDYPICVSDVITNVCQHVNDTRKDDRERNKLKAVLPNIMGTAPLKVKRVLRYIEGKRTYVYLESKDRDDKAYQEVEGRRQVLLDKRLLREDGKYQEDVLVSMSTKDAIKLINDLAALKPKASLKRKNSKTAKSKSLV